MFSCHNLMWDWLVLFHAGFLEGGARPLFPQWSHHVYPQFLPGSHPDASPPQNVNSNSMPPQNINLNHSAHHQQSQQRNHQLIRNHINNKLDQAAPQLRFRRNMAKPGNRHLSGETLLACLSLQNISFVSVSFHSVVLANAQTLVCMVIFVLFKNFMLEHKFCPCAYLYIWMHSVTPAIRSMFRRNFCVHNIPDAVCLLLSYPG